MQRYELAWAALLLIFLPAQGMAQTNSPNLKLVAHLDPLPQFTGDRASFSEVTGAGDLAILGGLQDFFVWIYDLSDRNRPELLATIPLDSPAWDVQVHGRYLFVALSNAMAWYDIMDPRQPQLVKRYNPTPQINPHTFFVAGNTLYVADLVSGGIRIFDITDKKNPKPLADIVDRAWSIHDMTILRNRLYGAWIGGQAGLLYSDVTNPAAPRELAKVRYPQAGTHHAWPTEDEKFILTTDEVSRARNNLKIWDARTPGQLTPVAEFTAPGVVDPVNQSIIHNVYVRGRYAYMSYYCEGVHIVDIADPADPQQVAFYDFTGNTPCESFNSNWGVYPYSNLIYASDMQEGLYVLEFADHPPANLAGKVIDATSNVSVKDAIVYFLDEYPTTRTTAAGEFGIPWFKNDTVRVVTEATGYRSDTTVVITRAATPTLVTIRLTGAPSLSIVKTRIDDDKIGGSFGNGNGVIDGVETIELNFDLQNTGFAALTSGAIELNSDDPYVKLIEAKQTIGQIGIGQTGSLNGALRFTLSPLVPADHKLSFELTATYNNQFSQVIEFELPVQPPLIKNFRASATASSVTLFWQPANEAQLSGYHLYRKPVRQSDAQFTKVTSSPIADTTFMLTGLTPGEVLTLAITKVVGSVETLAGARLTVVVRAGKPRVLVVNGIDFATYGNEMTTMYAAQPLNGGQLFDTWDVISKGSGFPEGYFIVGQTPQLTLDNLRLYEVVVWVGNNFPQPGSDLDAWYASLPALKQYLTGGGRLVLLTRMLNTFMSDADFVQNYLHLAGAQFLDQGPTVQQITPLQSDLIAINALANHTLSPGIRNVPQNGLVEPIFHLSTDPNTIMGIRVRQNANGPFNIAVIAGRPYRYEATALRTNMTTIINNYFGLATDVDETNDTVPENFALLPNYPNPFSPAAIGIPKVVGTQINFHLPHREKVQLEIFNVLGQRVRELLNAPRETGTHTLLWDGTDDAGQSVAAGVYIMRLRAGKLVAEKKMTIVR